MRIRGFVRLATLTVGYLLGIAGGSALALTPINSCPFTCTSNCYLNGSISCTTGNRITLQSGADLDMHGNSLTCSTGGGCSGPAVLMTANGSQVDNSLSTESVISGSWATGVDCDGNTSTKVTGIAIDGAAIGILNCAQVSGNRLHGGDFGSSGVQITTGTAATDFVSDNYIWNYPSGITLDNVTYGVSVDHNAITLRTEGIRFINTTATSIDILDNIFFGDTASNIMVAFVTSPPTSIFSGNLCDRTTGACGTCMSSTYCDDPVAPFTLP